MNAPAALHGENGHAAATDASRSRIGPTTARAETLLAVAEVTGTVDLKVLAFVARRFERTLGMIDAAEDCCSRNEAERLMAIDIDELAAAYRKMAAAIERGGAA